MIYLQVPLVLTLVVVTAIGIEDSYRLPGDVVPQTYTLSIILPKDFATRGKFDGTAHIQAIAAKNEVQSLTIHGTNLDITAFTVNGYDYVRNLVVNATTETIKVTLRQAILQGSQITITVNYTGKLYDDMYGFYRSSYTSGGTTRWIATTQFQATYARRAFPCFDEPQYKATFQLTIQYPFTYQVLSNQKSIQEILVGDGYTSTAFATTPTMSTYLVAFVVCDFGSYTNTDTTPITSVWAPDSSLATAKYTFETTPALVKYMESFTGIPFITSTINKIDQVAIPDFAAGAMENWGLLTYRETALLWDPAKSSQSGKQRVATVVAHELSHQWFGNLVTTKWWEYTWLNEGFATYFEYHATAKVEPDFELEKQFVLEQQQSVMVADGQIHSKSLNSPASSPSEVSAKFGSITYNKGGSVIRMMEHFLGRSAFVLGLRTYLSTNKFNNTVPTDLYKAFELPEPEIPYPLSTVMSSWADQAGYPVLTFSTTQGSAIKVDQQRFLYTNATSDETKWYIPVSYTTSKVNNFNNTKPAFWLKPNESKNLADEDGWIIANIQSTGYYRVNYDDALWDRVSKGLTNNDFDGIHVINRAQIVDDALNLARAGIIEYSKALSVLEYLEKEKEYYPWYSAFSGFGYLRRRLGSSDAGKAVESYILSLMEELYSNVTFDISKAKSHVDVLKTTLALSWACNLNNTDCVTKAVDLFKEYKAKNTSVNPNLRRIVYCTALANSANINSDWQFLWDKFRSSTLAEEQVTILGALGCTGDVDILKLYLAKSINSTSGIRKQDATSVFTAVLSGGPVGVETALDFLIKDHTLIAENYGSLNALSKVITGLADRLTDEQHIIKFEKFVNDNKASLKDAAEAAQRAIEAAKTNQNWAKTFGAQITTYLKGRSTGGGGDSSVVTSLLLVFACAIGSLVF